jgi:pimeloyl-ACP methyl ester carboxylesterase
VRLLIVLPLALYIALFVLALFSDRIIFQPQPSSYRDAGLGRQVVKLRSGDKTITAVYLPNPTAKYTLLFSHGNAEDIGDTLPLLKLFADAGFAVFAYDYRGYGTSQGHSSESSVYADINAAYDYLTQQLRVPPERIISMGRSLGSAAAIELASQRPVAALVVEAPFLSVYRVLTRVPLLPFDKFRNLAKIKRVRCPVLVIHGRADAVIPFWHGERIFALANPPKRHLWVDAAGHNDVLLVAGEAYLRALREFAAAI